MRKIIDFTKVRAKDYLLWKDKDDEDNIGKNKGIIGLVGSVNGYEGMLYEKECWIADLDENLTILDIIEREHLNEKGKFGFRLMEQLYKIYRLNQKEVKEFQKLVVIYNI